MPKIRHPMRPGEELDVTEREARDLEAQGLEVVRIDPEPPAEGADEDTDTDGDADGDDGADDTATTEGVRRRAVRQTTARETAQTEES